VGLTVVVGLLAGLIPATTAMRLQVVHALRKL
jgi:ABC-type lipoprotein release transport system permease subunit